MVNHRPRHEKLIGIYHKSLFSWIDQLDICHVSLTKLLGTLYNICRARVQILETPFILFKRRILVTRLLDQNYID